MNAQVPRLYDQIDQLQKEILKLKESLKLRTVERDIAWRQLSILQGE